jgi:hypothetical protein
MGEEGETKILSPSCGLLYGDPAAPAASCANVRFMTAFVSRRVLGLIEASTEAMVGPVCAFGRAYADPSAPPASRAGVSAMIDGTLLASWAADEVGAAVYEEMRDALVEPLWTATATTAQVTTAANTATPPIKPTSRPRLISMVAGIEVDTFIGLLLSA